MNILVEKVSNLESLTTKKSIETFKCTKCQFETNSEKGLKTHYTRKHTIVTSTGYPKMCELCEKRFNNSNDFKKHMKTHSYKEAKFKYADYDFVGKSLETMEVHLGKFHTDNYECGLCENDLGNLEDLSVHLQTCEIYRCKRCYKKEQQISDIKAHAVKKHNGNANTGILIKHITINRNDSEEVTAKEHWHHDL